MALTHKQQLFVDAYLRCWNATRAAIEAGYSEKTARQQGSRLLTNVDVQDAIQKKMAESAMNTNEVLYHLAQIARGDVTDLTDDRGLPNLQKAKALGKSNLIKKVRIKRAIVEASESDDASGDGPVLEYEGMVEGYDRLKALELIGRSLGIFKDNLDLTSGGEKIIFKTGMSTDEL
ncbi:MAG: terminase small subunit [Anaerolineaceae bacterium]|nr:terminase small subunit [Anaerolineaceae bacterium]